MTVWYLIQTAINVWVWRLVPCDWSRPYQDRGRA